MPPDSRVRAYFQFIFAVIYFFLARSLASHSAAGLASYAWYPLVQQAILAFLLLVGYSSMGFWMNRQLHPFSAQGLPRREGWLREMGMGLATGWGLAIACVLPMVLIGGIAISLSTDASSWGWLVVDAAFFAFATLAEEVAFRGYGFQRFVHAVGPVGATLGFAAYYAIVQSFLPGASRVSIFVSLAISLVLSVAYLRTRALWVSWGLNFGWKASRALLFGLAVTGVNNASPVVQGNPMGPFWVTGGGFGLENSWITVILVLAALPVVFHLTRDLEYRYNVPDIVPGGIPVDLSAAAQAQHEAATGEPAPPVLVQIGPAIPPSAEPKENEDRGSESDS
jgi:membrane protease YdiL (CAAX protease family)